MIIVLKNADFSQSNIGTLSSWRISRSLGVGATYEGPTSVDKDAAFSATVTIAEGYEIGTSGVTITMGGTVLSGAHSIEGNVITITIAEVTGNVLIKVPTINTSGGDEPEEPVTPTNYTFTINPDPTSATVTLSATGYSTVSGTGSKSITVANGTKVTWSVSADGYTEQTGNWTISGGNKTENIVLTASSGGDGEAYWISEKLTGNTIGSGTPNSLLGLQMFVIRDEAYVAELTGKTVESVAIGLRNEETTNGTLNIYLVDKNNEAPVNWVLKDTITGWAGAASTVQIKDLKTPFVVPSGYTIGYSGGSLLGAGTVTEGHTRDEYYYGNADATSATKITMAPFDVKVKA